MCERDQGSVRMTFARARVRTHPQAPPSLGRCGPPALGVGGCPPLATPPCSATAVARRADTPAVHGARTLNWNDCALKKHSRAPESASGVRRASEPRVKNANPSRESES